MVSRRFQLAKLIIYIRSSLWFMPALLTLGAITLAAVLIEVDIRLYDTLRERLPQLLITEPEGAHSMLSAIATSMSTIAGVVFSVTIVALTLASSQYSPRLLRNFMRDRANQIVLGVFVGVYVYCLMVLKTIRSGDDISFVPSIAVLVGLLSAMVAMGFFIFFIHHISTAIQASEIAAAITHETLATIDRTFTSQSRATHEEPPINTHSDCIWQSVPSNQIGYIQSVDNDALFSLACECKTTIRMEHKIGDFVGTGQVLVSILQDEAPAKEVIDEVNHFFAIGSYRTIEQDIAFGLRQLVDIALKALSPSINDTTTAVTCIEHLTVLLSHCTQRLLPQACRYDKNLLRVMFRSIHFPDLVDLSYRQILDNSLSNAEMIAQLLRSIERVAQSTDHLPHLAELKKWAVTIEEASRGHFSNPQAQRRVAEQFSRVQASLSRS